MLYDVFSLLFASTTFEFDQKKKKKVYFKHVKLRLQ